MPTPPRRLWPAAVALLGTSMAGCGESSAPPAPKPPEVPFAVIAAADVPIYLEAIGETAGSLDIQIRTRVEGTIDKIHFQEGMPVKKGDILYTIDPAPFLAKVREAEGNLAGAKANFVRSDNDLKRIRPLVEIDALSKRTLDAAVAEQKALNGLVTSAQATLEIAEIELGYTKITSPLDGLIGVSKAYQNDFVGRSPNPIVLNTVSKLDPIRVRFSISEQDYLAVTARNRGLSAKELDEHKKRHKLELFLADGSLHPHPGKFGFVGRELDATTGSLSVDATFPNPEAERGIRPGQFARVRSTMEIRKDAPLVPQRAVRELQGIYQVEVIQADDTIETRRVELGTRVGDLWLVEKGLSVGDRVAVGSLHRLRSGMKVVPVGPGESKAGAPRR